MQRWSCTTCVSWPVAQIPKIKRTEWRTDIHMGSDVKNEKKPWSGKVTAADNDQAPVPQEINHILKCRAFEESMIPLRANFEITKLVRNVLSTMTEQFLDCNRKTSFHTTQVCIWSAVCSSLQRHWTGDAVLATQGRSWKNARRTHWKEFRK